RPARTRALSTSCSLSTRSRQTSPATATTLRPPMRWIVDGMNVIGSRPDGWWRDRHGAHRALVEKLGALGEPVTVVFDGKPHDIEAPDGVEVVFAPVADDEIAARSAPGVTVVTSDR